ncbi:phosphoribosylanthranilate isomerase [Halanaerobium saccharolyticum]|uniref:N-(5'-phosphoribosyl)anthranilate isomerase n=1 Tax=Halanaerobium saccharolyticum TaxID=43595 RepID=A0A4R6RWB5_9FIRM|nr:phosphoribosylanthranilate isomerase [Halanaerobium saccharolyticum]TDP91322.1 phosphoribosylanthranilate isomerase [Halanaerobium saccharolyticum]
MLENRTMIKVCGMTRSRDIKFAVNIGVDAIGFILAESSRQVNLERVRELTEKMPPFIDRVAVVVNPTKSEVAEVTNSGLFDYIQFHGSEEVELISSTTLKSIKAISIAGKDDLKKIEKYKNTADFLLFDTKIGNQTGGTGRSFDWSLIRDLEIPYILAGGLGNENINEALQRLNPAAVDINSRIENEPGKKNHRLLKETVEKIKNFKPRTEAKLKLKSKQ